MKKRILNYIKNQIIKQYPNYSNDEIDEIMYGIEGLYLTITKTIIIFTVSFILGVTKNLLFLLLSFNIIRLFAFGIHANSSISCLIFSSFVFLSFSIICKYVNLDYKYIIPIYLIILIIIFKFAPADTVKRPLINKKRRNTWKSLSIITVLLYFIITLICKNNNITNYLLFGLIIESILIMPITYKIFNMPYENYKNYSLNT